MSRPPIWPAEPRSAPAALRRTSLLQAVALGLLQGPAELLPVSSSAHATLLPWLAGWSHAELDVELRKSFEVATHAGTAVALLAMGGRGAAQAPRQLALLMGSLAPPAVVGLVLERAIERRLGTPASIATGLTGGALAMAAADRLGSTRRRRADAGLGDGLALGLAQATALLPGVSRNAATLAMGRARGFERATAHALSREAALPVLLSAAALRGWRARSKPPSRSEGLWLATGALSALTSTLLAGRRLGPGDHDRSLGPFVAYRLLVAAVVVRRLRNNGAVQPSRSQSGRKP